MAEDSGNTRKHEEKNMPVDRSDTFLFKFARNLGRTARALKDGSTWLLGNSRSVADEAAVKKGEAPDVTEEEAAAGVSADVEAAVKAAAEPEDEEATAGVTADVEAAVKAAEEDAEDEVPPDVEAVVKAVEKATEK
jgi:hypothetical protein